MKLLPELVFAVKKLRFFKKNKNIIKRKLIKDYQQELLIKQGREQFLKLIDKGLQIPIAVL